jgi:hypothetical protein
MSVFLDCEIEEIRHVSFMEEMRNAHRILVAESGHLED